MENRTILIIEDDELNMKLTRSILQLNKYSVLEAENAEMGIQLTLKNKPDMILMDIKLPGMDGIEATKLILNNSDLKNTPILAISSFAMESDKDDALAAGIKEYITKPINKKNLLNTVKKYLN